MLKAAKERAKPQPNGAGGKKQGTAYGGSKQKDAPAPKKEAVEESVKVGDKVSFDHPMTAAPGKTMKKVGTVKKIEGDTAHLKSSTKYGTLSYQKKVSELRKEEAESVKEELKGDQHKLDKNKNGKLDAEDFKKIRKEDVALDEGKYGDDDWVIMKSGGVMDNPKKDTIVGYRKAGKGAYSAPKTEPGQKAMRISLAKKRGYAIAESAELVEAPNYKLYHTTFSAAVQEAIAVAKKQGFEVDEEDWQSKVATGPKKPSKDKTNSYSIDLTKNGSPTKKKLQIQVYNMGEKYELNTYVQ